MAQIYIGRQPILDRSQATIGYELLFRSNQQASTANVIDGDLATSTVLTNAISEIGLDNLVGGQLAFINLTEQFLSNPDLLDCLPPERVVLEILETVTITDQVVDGVTRLIGDGYTVALDDFEYSEAAEPLLQQVQIVKYDYTVTGPEKLAELAQIDRDAGRKVLVERIETVDEFNTISAMAVDYFQGYYFAKPTTLKQTGIPSSKIALFELLAKVSNPATTLEEITELVTRDVGLSVKALRYVNSAARRGTTAVESISQASVLLGRKRLRSWISVMLMANINEKPDELMNLALYRAKFCEILAEETNLDNPESCFTAGMLSLLDVMTDSSFEDILENLSLCSDVHDTLLGKPGPMRDILDQARTLERVDQGTPVDATQSALDAHYTAMQWAASSMHQLSQDAG
ncbi:MAG: HDOD domain-containing protein [Pseudomonadota bacterium]